MPKRELWHICADWLRGLGVLDPKSSVFAPNSRVYDLALALQDGVVLCNLANNFHKNVIETIHVDPEKQFLKMQNINAFLDVAQKWVSDSELFTADELYYASDFPKVISALSALSRSRTAKMAGISAFPEASVQNTATDDTGEDMYQSLEELVGQSISFQDTSASAQQFDIDAGEDEVYGSIMRVIDQGEDVYSAMLYSKQTQEESIYTTTGPQDKRSMVLGEIAETEKNYVEVLNTIILKFKKPLEAKLSKSDCKIIFSNVQDLLQVHIKLLAEIDAEMTSSSGRARKVSRPFVNNASALKIYAQFCCDVPKAMDKLKAYEKDSKVLKILEAAKQNSGQRFNLKDLLNVPMQRVLKYPLLLKELIKSTPDDHPDKRDLMKAKSAVDDLAVYINKYKKDHDCLCDMSASLAGYNGKLEKYAPFVKDGDLMYKDTKASKKDDRKLGLRYAFLLQSAIFFTKPHKAKYQYKTMLELHKDMEVVEVRFWTLPKEEQGSKYSFTWGLKVKDETQHIFAAKTIPAKNKWMSLMRNCIDDLRAATESIPDVAKRRAPPPDVPAPLTPSGPKPTPSPAARPPGKSYEEWQPVNKRGAGGGGDGPSGGGDGPASAGGAPGVFLSEDSWYADRMPREKAEKLFADAPDGSFLVRESLTRPGEYSLSVKYNIVKHIKINRSGKLFSLAPDAQSFASIQELIEHFYTHSLNRHFPGMETTLSTPYKDALRIMKGNVYGGQSNKGIGRARSRFAYTARSHDELTFERGVELIIISMKGPDLDPGWWKGSLPNGQIGIFPANYVQQL